MKRFAIVILMAALVAALGATQDMFPQESAEQINVDETELAQFVDTLQQIEQVQMETQQEMISVLNDLDLSTDRFNEIYVALTQDPELQQRVQQTMN